VRELKERKEEFLLQLIRIKDNTSIKIKLQFIRIILIKCSLKIRNDIAFIIHFGIDLGVPF